MLILVTFVQVSWTVAENSTCKNNKLFDRVSFCLQWRRCEKCCLPFLLLFPYHVSLVSLVGSSILSLYSSIIHLYSLVASIASVIILQKYVRFRYKSPVNQPLNKQFFSILNGCCTFHQQYQWNSTSLTYSLQFTNITSNDAHWKFYRRVTVQRHDSWHYLLVP